MAGVAVALAGVVLGGVPGGKNGEVEDVTGGKLRDVASRRRRNSRSITLPS